MKIKRIILLLGVNILKGEEGISKGKEIIAYI